ncbi:hypothetical protein [Pseudanabaena sp. FACHB-2040]|uniref:hypothetical protein n=1 Tax=Pseudanabaena sp. FACHB-2040 TaxID=2692859 RepID=UPI0016821B65|nr:hypothetical protein [Pseudanabaena sp. FACHB-2040]MBD2256963.1 hypothetical protein [Pseudanabaena sp. FACHB-2040]
MYAQLAFPQKIGQAPLEGITSTDERLPLRQSIPASEAKVNFTWPPWTVYFRGGRVFGNSYPLLKKNPL